MAGVQPQARPSLVCAPPPTSKTSDVCAVPLTFTWDDVLYCPSYCLPFASSTQSHPLLFVGPLAS
eukprot:2140955-Prymnesium_polylepis.1